MNMDAVMPLAMPLPIYRHRAYVRTLSYILAAISFTSGTLVPKLGAAGGKQPKFEPTKLAEDVKGAAEDSLRRLVPFLELALPKLRQVSVIVKDCGEVNAWYSDHQVTFCYELVEHLLRNSTRLLGGAAMGSATEQEGDDDLTERGFHQAMVFVLFHEMGHAYIDVAHVRTTGNEEDVADEAATYLMWLLDFDEVSSLGALIFFLANLQEDQVDVWDEHSPSKRRLASLGCWSLGANPERAEPLFKVVGKAMGDADGMANRAARCPQDWSKIRRFWAGHVMIPKTKL